MERDEPIKHVPTSADVLAACEMVNLLEHLGSRELLLEGPVMDRVSRVFDAWLDSLEMDEGEGEDADSR
jgi:hypothetical protein